MSKFCHACSESIDERAEICSKCGVRQTASLATPLDPAVREAAGKKMAAGLCGILLGAFGIHKFILGQTTPGVILLLATVLTCGIGSVVTGVIGLIEGILYLTKSDEDFYRIYFVEKKAWLQPPSTPPGNDFRDGIRVEESTERKRDVRSVENLRRYCKTILRSDVGPEISTTNVLFDSSFSFGGINFAASGEDPIGDMTTLCLPFGAPSLEPIDSVKVPSTFVFPPHDRPV